MSVQTLFVYNYIGDNHLSFYDDFVFKTSVTFKWFELILSVVLYVEFLLGTEYKMCSLTQFSCYVCKCNNYLFGHQ